MKHFTPALHTDLSNFMAHNNPPRIVLHTQRKIIICYQLYAQSFGSENPGEHGVIIATDEISMCNVVCRSTRLLDG